MNWKNIIADLKQAGWTEAQLADLCGCTQPNINLIASGRNVNIKYTIGRPLERLHKSMRASRRRAAKAQAI